MTKRRRFKQALSLSERFVQNVDHLERQLETLRPVPSEITYPNKFVKIRQPQT